MKKIKSIFSILVCVLLMLVSAIPAQAAATASNLDEVANGVFKFNMYIKGQELISGGRGSCFLINDDTIVTASHCTSISDAEYIYLLENYNLDQDEVKENLEYSVTLTRDLTVKATLLHSSQNMDFAILKLDQKINGHSRLALRDSKNVKRAERVYSVGFPVDKDNESTWDEAMVVYKEGIVNKSQFQTKFDFSVPTVFVPNATSLLHFSGNVLELSADIASGGNSGGPIVDADGNVVALVSCGNESTNFVSAIDQVMSACDTLGIEYTNADSETSATPTDTTVADTTAPETTKDVVDPEPEPEPINKTLIIGIGAAVAVIIVVAIVIVINSSKKKKAPAPSNNAGGFTPPQNATPAPTPIAESEGTTVLSSSKGDADATTVLGASAATAYLIRTSNNERINITKPYFKIGKDANRVDYCITGNAAVSRFHASIVSKNGQYFIVDNGTTNHTYVNESLIPSNVETQISNGAKIRLADEKFEFKI